MKEITLRKDIINSFKKYCIKCKGICCSKKDFAIFDWEFKKLPKHNKLIFLKSGGAGRAQSKKAGYTSLFGGCPFLRKAGCGLSLSKRPLDCISYPIYPLFRFYYSDRKEMAGMLVHKSCPLHVEISRDKKLINLMKDLWEKKLKEISKKEMLDWMGGKRNYWLDKNIIKINKQKI